MRKEDRACCSKHGAAERSSGQFQKPLKDKNLEKMLNFDWSWLAIKLVGFYQF